ncbi:MAG: alpha-1,4-glucan--maltose-1-phosphate maltosyltransferase [Actinomycetaceae bacterium]|nr:alpha-1,4-glucan--maltose-1-phosphate maltosyltransferase [Actinomycetaceae bacterium]
MSEVERLTRIPITEIFPVIEDGLWPAKAVEGESFPVRATVFREGHDAFAAEVVLLDPQGQEVQRSRMKEVLIGLDRCEAWVKPVATGLWSFRIDSWSDPYETWAHSASVKVAAQTDVELVLEEGALLMERAAQGKAHNNPQQKAPSKEASALLHKAAQELRDTTKSSQARLSAGLHSNIRHIFRTHPLRDLLQSSRDYPVQVDRERALYGSWYEIFPRSHGAYQDEDGTWHTGTLRTAADSLPRIARMGFDVIYVTPIHPIGTTFRKGKNNSLVSAPQDPGSPYGIGSDQGGHEAIHPDLGTFDDFDAFVQRAKGLGMEVALDIALQCSPDHPWVKDHPDWFSQRADGSIAYAENPPKKYQDIYPLNFDNDPEGIYQAIWDVLELWINHGVTIFRVDNPHTKPVAFWQRLLKEMRYKHPNVLFLAEAFTRPAMMRTLGAVGFHQSYTYFAWRNTKEELEEYFQEVAHDTAHVMRPTFWPTTHDILTEIMVRGGFAAHVLRAVLAATGAPSWGIYSGYELIENVQRPGFEEGIDNEKYEFKPRDFSTPTAVAMETVLTRLNSARRKHPALQRLRNITIHPTTNPNIICYSRHVEAWESASGNSDTVIVVVNLDPNNFQSGLVNLDISELGLSWSVSGDGPVMRVRDELDGHDYAWGLSNYVEFAPYARMAHVFAVEPL